LDDSRDLARMVRQPQIARPTPAERDLDLLLRPPVPAGPTLDVGHSSGLERNEIVVVLGVALRNVEGGLEYRKIDHFRFLFFFGFSSLFSGGPASTLFSGGSMSRLTLTASLRLACSAC